MTREQKIAEAQRLSNSGLSHPKIAARFGVHKSTVWQWLNPERAKEKARRANAHGRPRKRQWERDHRASCPECGRPMAAGSQGSAKRPELCRECWDVAERAQKEARRARIRDLWLAGESLASIAAILDSTPNSIGSAMTYMRRDGWDLPYARPGWTKRTKVAA